MSDNTQQRPKTRGQIKRAAWQSIARFIHTDPAALVHLPTTNPAPNPDRNMFALGRSKHLPSFDESCVDHFCMCQSSDGQIATNPRNYATTVFQLSQVRVSADTFALIEYL